ncbi:syncytin-2-like [Numida meleagris]|uniref:syncytin-2-like n=1 Tax=Numida meleagris TaxID=8996 RepID=UPI000B3DFAEE|nr:syncytin-2-like [Numida meleagris]
MLEDMNSLRHAVLQNRAAIDFLLLAQGHGCKEFDGMCCFNLSDHSESIQKQIHWLFNHTRSITRDHNPIDDWLHSVFPGLAPWIYDIIKEGVKWVLIIILLVIVARILYSCLLRATVPKTALVVTDNKDQDIIHDWLQDQGGHNPKDCFALQP